MENVSAVGIDLSKRVFHIHECNHVGRKIGRKKVKRDGLLSAVSALPSSCTIYVEATRSAHYWSREFERIGRRTKQIPPQLVKPYLKSQKNDFNDAEAICEAGTRPGMRFVPMKSENQQVLQQLHRVRERLVRNRTRLINQIRGFLSEHGVVLALGPRAVRQFLAGNFEQLSVESRPLFEELRVELLSLEERIKAWEKRMKLVVQEFPEVKRLCSIPGLGALTASAIVTSHGDFKSFRNGRHFAAWLGLVPAQYSSGGKAKLLGLTKRGNVYVRKLLVQGSLVVIRHALNKKDPHSLWIQKLLSRKGVKLTAIALANKNARIAWKLLVSDESFRADGCHGNF
jgi:transposase